MRYVMTALLAAGCVSSAAMASEVRGGVAAGPACELLTPSLAMEVSTASGRRVLKTAKPSEEVEGMTIAKGASVCDYGRIMLVLNPFARPDQVRSGMRARSGAYKGYEPVPGVGDEAFIESNTAFVNLYVWTGAGPLHIQMGAGFEDRAAELRPNVIALANAIIPKLR